MPDPRWTMRPVLAHGGAPCWGRDKNTCRCRSWDNSAYQGSSGRITLQVSTGSPHFSQIATKGALQLLTLIQHVSNRGSILLRLEELYSLQANHTCRGQGSQASHRVLNQCSRQHQIIHIFLLFPCVVHNISAASSSFSARFVLRHVASWLALVDSGFRSCHSTMWCVGLRIGLKSEWNTTCRPILLQPTTRDIIKTSIPCLAFSLGVRAVTRTNATRASKGLLTMHPIKSPF